MFHVKRGRLARLGESLAEIIVRKCNSKAVHLVTIRAIIVTFCNSGAQPTQNNPNGYVPRAIGVYMCRLIILIQAPPGALRAFYSFPFVLPSLSLFIPS